MIIYGKEGVYFVAAGGQLEKVVESWARDRICACAEPQSKNNPHAFSATLPRQRLAQSPTKNRLVPQVGKSTAAGPEGGAEGVTDIASWKGAAPRQALTQQWGNLESSPEEEPPSCPRLPLPPPGGERRAPCCPPSAPRPRGLRLIFPAGKRRAADKGMPVILANTISTPLISASCTRSELGWRSKEGPACSGAQGPLDPAKLPPGAEGLRMM
ncbi:hypothetical protein Cadr_000004437 [Camelus dromedarius]|uniref:Uncharacterized protein n=1 Tax=Camelus dromedarius TaxID=9838 RepID=A0A5N4EDT7_CAMDR|nr:hypothetical protein Cadr_000004437 [Camelus dromedarius]KAB1281525.1 hypothetical protein Cadr_000004437 [Camelus dromedarius]